MNGLTALLPQITALALEAGEAIMAVYATDFGHELKADASPVTEADLAAEAIIAAGLAKISPLYPVVAEEAAAAGSTPDVGGGPFWLVDPLDGTREFLDRNGEFTVNIALIEDGRPVLGVVHAPALEKTYTGIPGVGATGAGNPVTVRPCPAAGVTIVNSRRHGDSGAIDTLLRGHPVAERKTAGSSLKFCLIAEGSADIYPRFGRTMEWDTAAGHAVLAAAGGRVTGAAGAELTYGKPDFENPPFVAWGGLEPWARES
jgi:3'(2'), 5'-bisphosphate nucleotidase